MGLDLSTIEKAVLPLVCPLAEQLWTNEILPAILKAEANVTSPELKILADGGVAALDGIVRAELKRLASI